MAAITLDHWIDDNRSPSVIGTPTLDHWIDAAVGPAAVAVAGTTPTGLSIPIAMHHYKQMAGAN